MFEYCVGQPPAPISAADEQWVAPIDLFRPATVVKRQSGVSCQGGKDEAVTYGDYFTAVHDFLVAADRVLPRHLAGGLSGCTDAPDRVRIHLVKHGAFYHPACVTFMYAHRQMRMVLNVAVGDLGRGRLPVEAGHFEKLHRQFPDAYIPELYRAGVGRTTRGGPLPMFAAQWFDGFHEVHRTEPLGSVAQHWVVWDCEVGSWFLSDAQVADFFRRAVFILTYYFDPHTLSAIMEWHHAAGDFIVKRNDDQSLDVRLITVRRYGPLFHLTADDTLDVKTLLDALAVFFLRTSLWMRLDRLDGVGELVWARETVLRPIWEGFLQGLEQFARLHHFPETFAAAAAAYFANHDRHDLRRMGLQILEHYPPDMPEAVMIALHLDRHAACLATLMQERA